MGVEMQRTVAAPVSVEGIGLHSGRPVRLTIRPAGAGEGIRWRRIDLPGHPEVAARPEHVTRTDRCTVLAAEGCEVQTVEHVMAALYGCGVDNCVVELDGPEAPIADGSAAPFVEAIRRAGLAELAAERRVLRLSAPVWIDEGTSSLVALPAESLRVSCLFVNDRRHPALHDQFGSWEITAEVFDAEIAPARTFGFLADVEALRARGLALGGSLSSAVVFGEREVLTPLRFHDEPVRHKVLDLVGDLALAGRVEAHILAIRPSHRLNNRLARAVAAAAST